MKKPNSLTVSVASAIMCLCVIAGSVFAIFIKSSAQNISVTSGQVNVEAAAEGFRWYSVKPFTDDDNGALTGPEASDEFGNGYYYKEVTGGRFLSGGRAIVSPKEVSLLGVAAGDKIEFDIKIKNESDIAVQYYANLFAEDDDGIFGKLDVNFDGAGMMGAENVRNEWTTVAPSVKDVDTVHVTVAVPVTADKELQNGSLKLKFAVIAQQYTSPIEYVAEVGGVKYATLAEAVSNAEAGGTVELLRSSVAEEGEVIIDKSLSLKSAAEGDLNPRHTLTGARISVREGAVVNFDNLGFSGNSYLNVSGASAVKLTNCTAIVNPYKIYDAYNRRYVDRAAFIVSDESNEIGIKLNVEDCKIYAARANSDEKSAAIYMASYLAGGSSIRNTEFGGDFDGGRYSSYAVWFTKGVRNTTAALEGNDFYGGSPLCVGKDGKAVSGAYGTFSVRSIGNKVIGGDENGCFAEIAGNSAITFLDTGSEINGRAVSCGDIRADELRLFCGINVGISGELFSRGTFKLGAISEESFRSRYAETGAYITLIK